jgi:alkylation response protein AidB-like acyl-CoA dehydrogenase
MSATSSADEAFRQEVRAFIAATIPPDIAERNLRGYHPTKEDVLIWTRALNEKGWSVPNWPVEYGGPGWSIRQRHIFEEESYLMGAPPLSPQGVHLVGPLIYAYGTPEQKEFFLPKIRSAEHQWAQGFSEPNAGSDLVSLQTRAVREGDHYVVNGQKIWTSDAHHFEWLFLLVRTNVEVKKQAGISFLLVDLKTPGITVRPIIGIDGAHSLNEVFLQDVRVPVENLLGEENKGWTYAKQLLADERSFSAYVSRCKGGLRRLRAIAEATPSHGKPLAQDPDFAVRMAQLEIEVLAHETTTWRVVEEEEAGRATNAPTSSILKVRGTELLQRIGDLMVEALGDYAAPLYPEEDYRGVIPNDAPGPSYAPGVVSDFMYLRAATIFGGANEIQRNLIANMLMVG